jgi:hypothetical protein
MKVRAPAGSNSSRIGNRAELTRRLLDRDEPQQL